MKKLTIFLYSICQMSIIGFANAQCIQNPEFNETRPKRDLRGVFLASVYNLDWPTNRNATPAEQQVELITILNNLKTNGYNSVFLQIRPECDALYASTLEPWSYRLTGTQGLAPSPLWDPLTFAVTEAHIRGLDLHAWINPYRVRASITEYSAATNSILNTQPTWILTSSTNSNLKILNPGLPAVRNYIKTIVQDISTRYDVDGIHFDDYFYPDGGMTTNQDNQTFLDNNPTNIPTISDWRRENVNIMIATVYDAIQVINSNLNKNIIFGVSPFGIWKSGTPTGIVGNPSFSSLFCDPISWLNTGKIDYLAPQLYWKITGAQDYTILSKWWNDQIKLKNKQLYVSQGYFKMTDANNWAGTEIQDQINLNRSTTMDATFGQISYRYFQIKNNDKTINTLLNSAQYQFKSFAPPIIGKDAICPNPPVNIRFNGQNLKWNTPAMASDGDLPVKYVVYAFDTPNQAITNKEDGTKILDIIAGNELLLTQNQIDTKYFVVSSLDKNNNENGNFAQTTTLSDESFDIWYTIAIYPNPFTDQFNIENNGQFSGKTEINIYDFSGKLVWKENYENISEEQDIVATPINLSNGFYIGKILNNGNSKTFKLIKQ